MRSTGVAIVTYNSEKEIAACLAALESIDADVVVIDNGSTDRTCECVRAQANVRLISNPWNRGFAAAVNQSFDLLSEARVILLLNPDAVVEGDIAALAEACAAPGAAAVGGKLVGSDRKVQRGFAVRSFPTPASAIFEALGLNRLWFSNPVNRRYRRLDIDLEKPADVEQPAGAFLAIGREAWTKLGGFDERFFPLWFEDVDFLQRAAASGYRISYVPSAVAIHAGGHSVRALSWERRQLCWYDSLLKYARKHFSPLTRGTLAATIVLGFFLRTLFGVFSSRSIRPLFVCGRAVRLAGSHLR